MSAELAREIADGLRALAQMIEDNPHLAASTRYAFEIRHPAGYQTDVTAVEELAALARAGKASGAAVTKRYSADYGYVTLAFGAHVSLGLFASREEVCEKVVTGTEVVIRTVPDPSIVVPTIDVPETVETFEWVCKPLLAEAGGQ